MVMERSIAKLEAFFKGMMFDCRCCGQCVLQKTGLICPMSCPKGLRNGPCGGTVNGECEVYPDKQCVWVRIHKRVAKESYSLPQLIASPDSSLFHTSSYVNYFNGKDLYGRTPLEYLDLGSNRTQQPLRTSSGLEKKLKEGVFVKTCEIRSPREANITAIIKHAELVKDHFDAVNATAYLNGRPSLPSPRTAAELVNLGLEPISQATCRDHTKTSFVSELITNSMNGVHNILCLTGDSYVGSPKIKQVFDMDSSLMLYEASHLREKGVIHFTGVTMKKPPRLFLGAAINPFTTPDYVPIRRLKQKVAAGADFIQTQLIFDVPAFREFMKKVCREGLDKEVFILAGVPVVISPKACEMIPKIPGISVPEKVYNRLSHAADLKTEGVKMAQEMVLELKGIEGVRGVHLMLFGMDHSVLPQVAEVLKNEPLYRQTIVAGSGSENVSPRRRPGSIDPKVTLTPVAVDSGLRQNDKV